MIDVCCVNYNTVNEVQRFLQTLNQSDSKLWKLFVADNGSTDGSAEILKDNLDKYNVTQGFFNENIGYARACNQLASLGNSDIIGLCNADVWFLPDHIQQILNTFAGNPNVSIVGPKQRNERGEIVHAGIFGTMKEPKHRGWKQFDPEDEAYRDFRRCVTVSGSAYFIRRKVWEALTACSTYQDLTQAVGAFLPTPHYYEETWCSYHAIAHGYEVWYDGRMPSLGHSWHASSGIGSSADAQFPISQQIFRNACDKHFIPHD